MEIRDALRQILRHEDLSRRETQELFGRLMEGEVEEVHKAALLVGLAMKGESAAEIAGAASAMRERVVPIPHSRERATDTCGTGGDRKGTFNISTAAALVAAAAGAPIAKHGNRSVSSRSGSADVLEALGVGLEATPEEAGRALDQVGIAFLFAPRLHPAMKEVMGVRRTLGVRTVFNLLGPLTNPAGARRQLLGVYARDRVEDLARVLLELGSIHALVVHGADGLDEISTTGPTHVAEVREGAVRTFVMEPESFGIEPVPVEALEGGTPEENAETMERLLAGEADEALEDIVSLNAAAALYVAGEAGSISRGLEMAREVLVSGGGARKLEELKRENSG